MVIEFDLVYVLIHATERAIDHEKQSKHAAPDAATDRIDIMAFDSLVLRESTIYANGSTANSV